MVGQLFIFQIGEINRPKNLTTCYYIAGITSGKMAENHFIKNNRILKQLNSKKTNYFVIDKISVRAFRAKEYVCAFFFFRPNVYHTINMNFESYDYHKLNNSSPHGDVRLLLVL